MKSLTIILFAVLCLLLFANARHFRTTFYKSKPVTTTKSKLMRLSKNLTRDDRIKLRESCKGTGMVCYIAEDCCSLKCVTASKRCVQLLYPGDLLTENIYGI